MDVGTALSVAQTLFAALQCTQLSILGYKSQLDGLKVTVQKINAVLRDAEAKHELSQQDQQLIEQLKDAVFEADDLFDEFVTVAEQKQLLEADGSVSKKVRNFFSRSKNPLSLAYRMSHGVKDIKKKLDAIAYNEQFDLKIDPQPIRKRSRETCSYVNKVEIIGREHDLEEIVGMLLDPNDDQRDVSVLSIVGIGGLGKTALAQLVYNDPRVTNAFQLKLWACVSDENQERLNVTEILGKILGRNQERSTLDRVQSELRDQLAGKKYLLILDDVWTEKHDQWCELAKYLIGEKMGSWIVVTTRSQKTATITGGLMYKLSGLSKEDSWCLFERTAFSLDKPKPTDELVEIGKNIVNGCSGVPLAIRVVGSLLFGQDKNEWLSVQKIGLVNKADYNVGIMPILKLSFHQLEAPLKNCFRYCALFPKDYVIRKKMLIRLWMAQGYIVPRDKNQSIDEAGEEYFSILLKRCFFQDIKENWVGEIKSCKIHDLMHDIAQNVSGNEMRTVDSNEGNVDDNVRHLSNSGMSEYEEYFSSGKTHIRSLLSFDCGDTFQLLLGGLVKRFKFLRVLDLSDNKINLLPDSIGKLLHLRYIDLSNNKEMEVISNSITKLCNLQTLILKNCCSIKELPKDLCKLVKLKFLDLKGCRQLTCMPRGMGKLTCLHTLRGNYQVGGREKYTSWKQWLDELENLKTLINLRGKLIIRMKWPRHAKNDVKEDRREGLYLRSMEHVSFIALLFGDVKVEDSDEEEEDMEEEEGTRRVTEDSGTVEDEERIRRVMEDLQPHSNLKGLAMAGYDGVKMPSWFTATLLPNLVELALIKCEELEYLPCLRNLCHLKFLWLEKLPMLEYIVEEEEDSRMLASTSTAAQKASIFPSLEKLELVALPKFEGWRRVGVEGMEESAINNNSSSMKPQLQICLPQLEVLEVDNCPELTCTLLCPMLEILQLRKFNERLEIKIIKRSTKTEERLREAVIEEEDLIVPKLRTVDIDKVGWLNSMPIESFHTTLQSLRIEDDDEMEDLPNWIQHLSALQSLTILSCKNLKAIPNWMPKLTSLRQLRITFCPDRLKKRCQEDPPGEDWPYIQHIPHIEL